MKILALEASTSSAKAMLYETDSHQNRVVSKPYDDLCGDGIGHVAEEVFQRLMAVGKEVLQGETADIIVLGDVWHSLLICDSQMAPLTNVMLWSDTSAAEVCKALRKDEAYVDAYYQKTGCMVNGIYPYFKLLYLKEKGYDFDNQLIVDQGTYNMFRLTGEKVTTLSMLSGTGLMNVATKDRDEALLKSLGLKKDNFCEIIDYSQTFPLSQAGAYGLGLEPGVPVMAANPDGGLNQVGSGASEEGIMTLSAGTSGALRLTVPEPKMADNRGTWCYRSPKGWLSGAAISGCCNCLDWAKDRIYGPEARYEVIEAMLDSAMATPVFLPFLYGERCPGWEDDRRSSYEAIDDNHDKEALYLSVMEGVIFNLYQCYEILVEMNGVPDKIKLSGGIVNSPLWRQMCVSLFDQAMVIDGQQHSSLMGSIALAMEVLGLVEDASECDFPEGETLTPDETLRQQLLKKYENYLVRYNIGRGK